MARNKRGRPSSKNRFSSRPVNTNHHVEVFASLVDNNVTEQANQLARLPFVHPHVALMPDAHYGMGSAVGTVFGTIGAVIPAAVGVDIGCGMIGVRTGFTATDLAGGDLTRLRDAIEAAIPLSPGNYNEWILGGSAEARTRELAELAEDTGVDLSHSPKWRQQLGSLGGGNHFIELCLDEEDRVWMFLHSGSRGVGNKIAQKHIATAQEQCDKHWVLLENRDLAYLVEDTAEFDSYIADLAWAQRFAWLNREEMMDRFARVLGEFVGAEVAEAERINCHHNYTQVEEHYGREVWLTRKGAIRADEGVKALIPGSMGTSSYVVSGKGFAPALRSAPHGAGRRFSRTEARKRFTAADLDERMGGIVYRPGDAWVDEIPDAYKDIDQVMVDAEKLVSVEHKLRQILNVKGT
ncbi:RtcB family protein [Corynebacterium sanguinis]|uniref:RtcB family protein n=1 Tax=Corynebacterium sanguinis TaxID=2594913 RepID=UPI00223B5786|nr:RtcB family protein [Corynebacterium sanguinis]MCT2288742.1 RtcB family protein [Corynebacterium sanguinis]